MAVALIRDDFNRAAQESQWGTATTGEPWTSEGPNPADHATTGSSGIHSVTSAGLSRRSSIGAETVDADVTVTVSTDKLAAGAPLTPAIMMRSADLQNLIMFQVRLTPTQTVQARIAARINAEEQSLAPVATIAGLTHTVGGKLRVRAQATGFGLRMRIWDPAEPQPTVWHVTTASDVWMTPGRVGLRSLIDTGSTVNGPVTFTYDDFSAQLGPAHVGQVLTPPRPVPPIHLLVTDRFLNVVGDPIYCWDTVDVTLRFNEVSSGQFTCPAHPWIREQLEPGNRIVVVRDGKIFMAGPWERRLIERSDDGENAGIGKLTVEFADDLSLVVSRNAYPDPTKAPEDQAVDYWEYSGNAEVVLQNLANVSAGPGARAERRIPRLVMAGPTGVGTSVSGKLRLDQLGDAMRSIALAGGGLGFRTRQVGTDIRFETYGPRDLTSSVRFGFGLGNLRYLAYEENAPSTTTAIVGGQGEGADRLLMTRTDTALESVWGRREVPVPRPGNDPPEELQQAGDEVLAREAATARLQSSAWDTEDQRYGEHYGLGDRVSVEVGPGEQVSDLVRLVHLQAWATAGELVSAMVGGQEASTDPKWIHQMREIGRRLARLERTSVPAA
ncbi:siphovirus ReqiPepy6 Gp37-like family protein [Micromonospora sp. NPDC049366]|uniref:siphovirus ReqiPepy6 Gp37-like family protein n=1 Tax=Micromonospora sp. NPDC049366 TaxID=3364271 RepID=UPI0037B402B8